MANKILIKRGTRAQLEAAKSPPNLAIGELYYITDEQRIAVGTANNNYQDFLKANEAAPLDADLTAIAALSGTSGVLRKTNANTWTLDTNTFITAEAPNFNLANGATFAGSSGSVKVVAAGAASGILTLPNATGTLAVTSQIPTVNNNKLDLTVSATPAATGATITVPTGTGFTANDDTDTTYSIAIGPALKELADTLTGTGSGFLKKDGADNLTVDTNTYITGNQSISVSGDVTGTGSTTIGLTLATVNSNIGDFTKVTVNAKGLVTAATTLAATDIPSLTAAKISDFNTAVQGSRLDQMAAPTGSVSLNSQKITGLATPTEGTDAANKNYVDTAVQGLAPKDSVRAATTVGEGNITLSGLQTIDDVPLAAGNRVLVKNQTSPGLNGIYNVVAGGPWTRSADASTIPLLISAFTFVEEGTVNGDNGFVCTVNAGAGAIDVAAIEFVQFSGAGQITAGTGLTKTGNTLNVGGTTDRITVGTDAIDISTNYVGQTSITTLGAITSGTWTGTQIGAAYGGTGQTTYTVGDFLYATAATTLGKLTNTTTAQSETAARNVLVMDPATGTPSWSSTIDGGTF